jgi:hypothetical protein
LIAACGDFVGDTHSLDSDLNAYDTNMTQEGLTQVTSDMDAVAIIGSATPTTVSGQYLAAYSVYLVDKAIGDPNASWSTTEESAVTSQLAYVDNICNNV